MIGAYQCEARAGALEDVLDLLDDVERGLLDVAELRRRVRARARTERRVATSMRRGVPETEVEVEEVPL
jgi:hypothetical protein